ncbi:hypothetical protein PR202_gb28594 [Eleusine coracana subsp. coracana]|uniref:Uncharacterized protein n=1 Tax=Eleusine coracana subsp. coracana TaxID=191504 RepID=A0AAV5FXM3_ELECO|nr:hypothetical protein PR202_gb28594 [Eleusine coracana subsp. coracana]
MTSAVLPGRNEVHHAHPDHRHWGGLRGASLKPKPPIPNPRRHRPGPNPNPIPRPAAAVPWQAPAAPPPEPSTSRYVSIRVAGMTQLEARQAQARLTGELGRVRALLARIDTWQDGRRRESGPGPRRHASPTPPALRAAMLKRCGQILTRLRKQKISHWFHAPVDVEGLKLYDYRAIIRCPMDLGTVKENLAGGRYPSHEEFAADVRLTFNNALRYNPPGHQVHTAAGNLLASFEGMYKEAISWFEQEFQRLEPPMPLALPPPPQQQPVPVPVQAMPRMGGARRPKPKAREPNKREMYTEEKDKLRVEIENLPYDKLVDVLQIVQKRNSDPALKGEDVELDFDLLDVETLWELDRFVLNWKKACSKGRQNVAMNGDTAVMNGDTVDVTIVPDEDDMVQVEVNPPIVVEIGESGTDMLEQATEADMGDEYVDIGDEMPTVNYQSVEIEKDTQMASTSSESGSGSSASSDSGSRSSADSDSDGDDARSPD